MFWESHARGESGIGFLSCWSPCWLGLERTFLPERGEPASDELAPQRVKRLRQSIIRLAQDANNDVERERLRNAMNDLFLAIQLYSYPGDYLAESPSLERIAETVDKLEEDVLLLNSPRVRGTRRVRIRFGEPLLVPTGARRKGERGATLNRTASNRRAIDADRLGRRRRAAKCDRVISSM